MKLYIAVLDEFPDYMVPTLVAHSILAAHLDMSNDKTIPQYWEWLGNSFKKCVVRVNQKEFDKICQIPGTHVGYEKNTLDGRGACAIPPPVKNEELPNVLKFAKLWKPL